MRYHGALVSSMLGLKTLVIDCSNQHRHYYNNLDYLEKRYCNLERLDFDKINEQSAIDSAIKKLAGQKALPYGRDKISRAEKVLEGIVKLIN